MKIIVNGEAKELTDRQTVRDLLSDLGYEQEFVAVAVNNVCINRSDFARTDVQAGDKLEILAPMAGG